MTKPSDQSPSGASLRAQERAAACRVGVGACACIVAGCLLSGPGAMLLVSLTRPQPTWRDARRFVENYHDVQALPYFLGFLLVGGFLGFLAGLHGVARETHRARAMSGLVFGGVGAALVFHNYVLQTTFVPGLVRSYVPEHAALIAALSMANPASLAWGLEMWGYGLIGIGTLFSAPVLFGPGLGRFAAGALVLNGWASVAGALWTAARPGWVMSDPGLLAFAGWNLLAVVMAVLALAVLRKAGRDAARHPSFSRSEG